MKKVNKVKFSLPSESELVADFNFISSARTIEHCWLFISLPSDTVFLACTRNSQTAIDIKCLGSVVNYDGSRWKMLKEAIFMSYLFYND